jgi:hypothetical protein
MTTGIGVIQRPLLSLFVKGYNARIQLYALCGIHATVFFMVYTPARDRGQCLYKKGPCPLKEECAVILHNSHASQKFFFLAREVVG